MKINFEQLGELFGEYLNQWILALLCLVAGYVIAKGNTPASDNDVPALVVCSAIFVALQVIGRALDDFMNYLDEKKKNRGIS